MLTLAENLVKDAVGKQTKEFTDNAHLPRDRGVRLLGHNVTNSSLCKFVSGYQEGHRVGVNVGQRGLNETWADRQNIDAVFFHFHTKAFAVGDNGNIKPRANITRAEIATIIKALEDSKDKDNEIVQALIDKLEAMHMSW